MKLPEPTYESLSAQINGLRKATARDDRYILWCNGGPPLGISRDPDGFIEIFIESDVLVSTSRLVQENLEFQKWSRLDGEPFNANRLLLPTAAHFEKAAAFICIELLRAGIATNPKDAFLNTEPLIEVWLEQMRISQEAILGLCGELLILNEVTRAVTSSQVKLAFEAWKGYRKTSRDLQLGDVGVEIKTTTATTSSHLFNGVEQLEVGHGVDGLDESSLLLMSIGLNWAEIPDDHLWSLPKLMDSLIGRIHATCGHDGERLASEFTRCVYRYGSEPSIGYDHRTMSDKPIFNRPFSVVFARCYDMEDRMIKVFRTDDLREKPNVQSDSLQFRVNLPHEVTGSVNPVHGLANSAREIIKKSEILR